MYYLTTCTLDDLCQALQDGTVTVSMSSVPFLRILDYIAYMNNIRLKKQLSLREKYFGQFFLT